MDFEKQVIPSIVIKKYHESSQMDSIMYHDEILLCAYRGENNEYIDKIYEEIPHPSKLRYLTMPISRNVAELQREFVQLVVYCVVETHEGNLVVENKKGMLCFPGGHVTCNEGIKGSVFKELKEEINVSNEDVEELQFKGYILFGGPKLDHINNKHIGIVYYVKLNENTNLKNNEPEKFSLCVVDRDELFNPNSELNKKTRFDGWIVKAYSLCI